MYPCIYAYCTRTHIRPRLRKKKGQNKVSFATLYNCSINNRIYSIYELRYFNLPNLTKLSENSKIPLNPRFCVFAVR